MKPMQTHTESKRTLQIVDQLLTLRLLVGFLGQGKQCAWWNCNFLDATGVRFLETTFVEEDDEMTKEVE